MNKLNQAELGYIAAMFDGEGYIGLNKTFSQINPSYGTSCRISNTNKSLLKWLQTIIGFGRISPPKIKSKNNHKERFDIEFRMEEAKELLTVIIPYLVVKQSQAILLLEFINLSRGKIGSTNKPDELILEHELIYRELTALNKRGI